MALRDEYKGIKGPDGKVIGADALPGYPREGIVALGSVVRDDLMVDVLRRSGNLRIRWKRVAGKRVYRVEMPKCGCNIAVPTIWNPE